MLNEHTLAQLRALRLDGMVAALADAATQIAASELPFEQRLALLVQREVALDHAGFAGVSADIEEHRESPVESGCAGLSAPARQEVQAGPVTRA